MRVAPPLRHPALPLLYWRWLLLLVALLALLLPAPALSAETTQDQARAAVTAWLARDGSPLDTALGGSAIDRIDSCYTGLGTLLYHAVHLTPSGYVIVAGSDEIEPIIAFSNTGAYVGSSENPLASLAEQDLESRITALRDVTAPLMLDGVEGAEYAPVRPLPIERSAALAVAKWEDLAGTVDGDGPLDPPVDEGTATLTENEIYVPILVETRWNQGYIWVGGVKKAVYNYYTPTTFGNPPGFTADNADNYVCGCVATAFAQILRYHQYPTSGIGVHSYTCTVTESGSYNFSHSTRGGNGSGGAYDWANMVAVPGSSITDAQRAAIGALTHDTGTAVEMNWSQNSSGASTALIADRLVDRFGYSSAFFGCNYNGGAYSDISAAARNKMVNPNLDAGLPVGLSISGNGGHAVVADGYGYQGSTWYTHINMGWAGSSDAWYNLPEIGTAYNFNVVKGVVFNIFISGTGEIISGRVVDGDGNPVSGATVTAAKSGGGSYQGTTNARGIYAIYPVPSSSSYTVSAAKTGYNFTSQECSTGLSRGFFWNGSDWQTDCGNVWALNFAGTANPNQLPVAVAACLTGSPKTAALVTLSGSGSYDPDGDAIVTYAWSQLSGPAATLDETDPVHPAFTPAAPGTYVFKLTVTDEKGGSSTDGSSPNNEVSVVVAGVAAPSLASPAAGASTTDQTVAFSWGSVDGAEYYYLYVYNDTNEAAACSQWVAAPATSHSAPLLPGCSYTWKVKARDADAAADSVWSASRTLTVTAFPAPAPSSPADGATVTEGQVTVSWGSVAGADYYYVTATNTTDSLPAASAWVAAPATSYALPALNGKSYSWQVKAYKSASATWSAASAARSFTAQSLSAPALSSPNDEASVTAGTVTLTWGSVAGAEYYYVTATNTTDSLSACASWVAAPATSYALPTLAGKDYSWQVKAYDVDTGTWSANSATRTFSAQGFTAPTLSSPNNGASVTAGTVTLSWNAVAGAEYYYVTATNTTDVLPAAASWVVAPATSYALPALAGKDYSWQVKAYDVDTGSWSASSATRTFSAQGFSAPTLVSPNSGASVTAGTVTLSWNAVAGAEYYYVTATNTTDSLSACAKWVAAPGTSLALPTLPGKDYSWEVKAYDADTGSWSVSSGARTFSAQGFGAPTLVSPNDGATGTARSVDLQWNAVAGAEYYYVYVTVQGPGTPVVATWIVAPTTNKVTQPLAALTTYEWWVKAYDLDSASWSAQTPTRTFTTGP